MSGAPISCKISTHDGAAYTVDLRWTLQELRTKALRGAPFVIEVKDSTDDAGKKTFNVYFDYDYTLQQVFAKSAAVESYTRTRTMTSKEHLVLAVQHALETKKIIIWVQAPGKIVTDEPRDPGAGKRRVAFSKGGTKRSSRSRRRKSRQRADRRCSRK